MIMPPLIDGHGAGLLHLWLLSHVGAVKDFINGLFEGLASFMVLNHCRVLRQHCEVRGVSLLSTAFFLLWGIWNLFYYPSLGQIWSCIGGGCVVIANSVYLFLLLRYTGRLGRVSAWINTIKI